MNNTSLRTASTGSSRTWWWHPRPCVAVEADSSSGTWWWHPRPVV